MRGSRGGPRTVNVITELSSSRLFGLEQGSLEPSRRIVVE